MASELRNVSLSLHYRLWALLRQHGWFTTTFGVDMELVDPDVPLTYHNADLKRPFVFLDQNAAAWPSGVRVYDMGNPLPSGQYTVDYLKSTVTLAASPSGAVTADISMYGVTVKEGYMEGEELEQAQLPVIAYEVEGDDQTPFDIGHSQQKWRRRDVVIDIYATNDGERKDLHDNVGRYISVLPYLDFSEHQPLDEQNNVDLAFDFADQWNGNLHMPDGVRGELLKPRPGGSDKERYRSLVSFTCEQVS